MTVEGILWFLVGLGVVSTAFVMWSCWVGSRYNEEEFDERITETGTAGLVVAGLFATGLLSIKGIMTFYEALSRLVSHLMGM